MVGAIYAAATCTGSRDAEALMAVAQAFSPRVECWGPREITLDLDGLSRLFGDPRTIAEELRKSAADRGLQVRVGIARSGTAARLLVRHRAGLTVVDPGMEAVTLAALPLAALVAVAAASRAGQEGGHPSEALADEDAELAATFRRWGLRTVGDLAALPAADLAARLGQRGVAWQRMAQGEDPRPLVPSVPDERFEAALDLEWPIDGLEPLSFVLGRLLEPLAVHLERRDRGAAVLHVRLHLVGKTLHERRLELPAPMRDARALRTLALLDLESHPPGAAIDRVVVAVDPTPGRALQYSLLTRPVPAPEQISTLMARLGALMGDGRCGSPAHVESWKPGAFAIRPFAPPDVEVRQDDHARPRTESAAARHAAGAPPIVALRRFRFAVPARVTVEQGRPVRVHTDRRGLAGGRVELSAGPWRTSGQWWEDVATVDAAALSGRQGDRPWDRDEWDVSLSDGATYRVFRERSADVWFVEGIVD